MLELVTQESHVLGLEINTENTKLIVIEKRDTMQLNTRLLVLETKSLSLDLALDNSFF